MMANLGSVSECRWLRGRDQLCVAVGAAICLVCLASYLACLRGGLVDIDRAPPLSQRFCLDINRADWPEWTLLPGIGETLARRIVESRAREGDYRRPEDLLRVRGIGPNTLERLRPHLLPLH